MLLLFAAAGSTDGGELTATDEAAQHVERMGGFPVRIRSGPTRKGKLGHGWYVHVTSGAFPCARQRLGA
jgi:hypothetical protein